MLFIRLFVEKEEGRFLCKLRITFVFVGLFYIVQICYIQSSLGNAVESVASSVDKATKDVSRDLDKTASNVSHDIDRAARGVSKDLVNTVGSPLVSSLRGQILLRKGVGSLCMLM